MNNAIGRYKYGNDFTISKITNSCKRFPSLLQRVENVVLL